jgi:signal transduction histidine kinase
MTKDLGSHSIWGSLKARLQWLDRTLVGRMIAYSAVWFIVSFVVTAIGLTALFQKTALTRFEQSVGQMADNLYSDTEILSDNRLAPPALFDTRVGRIDSGLYWQIYEGEGTPKSNLRSQSLWDRDISFTALDLARARQEAGRPVYFNSIGPRSERVRAGIIYSVIENRSFYFIVAEDREGMDKEVARFGAFSSVALFVISIGALLAIWGQVRLGLKPLFSLTEGIEAMRNGQTSRLHGQYPIEIMPVADQINALMDHTQQSLERHRTHVGNLAHALKTPLSVLMGLSERMAYDQDPRLNELREQVDKQVVSMKSQIDHHLRRARIAARSSNLGELTDLDSLLDEMSVMMEQIHHQKGIEIDWRCEEGLHFHGEKQDLMEIVGNLLENAAIWCRHKVKINASFEPNQVLSSLILIIEDDGPGLREERYEDVLKRGLRLDESRPGSGLGLSIVDELVRAYQGYINLDRSPLGGLKVSVKLPGQVVKPLRS